jgi:PAS domain S-box-containing protein
LPPDAHARTAQPVFHRHLRPAKIYRKQNMLKVSRSTLLVYGVAVTSIMLATLLRLLLQPVLGNNQPYVTYVIAVVFTAWFGGLRPALLALVLGALGAIYFFVPPENSLAMNGPPYVAGLMLYLTVGITSALLSEAMHRARRRAEEAGRQLQEEQIARFALAAIVESSDDAIIGKTLDGIITSWNTGAERLYGYTVEEAIGQPISLLVPQERPDELPQILDKLKRGARIEHYETIRITKTGARLNISLAVSPIKNASGEIIGASAIARDITGAKRAQVELQESEMRFRQLAENLQEVFWISDAQTSEMIYITSAYEEIWGRSRESLYASPRSFIDGIHPDDRERVNASLVKQIEGSYNEEYRVVRPDGSTRWVWARAFPIKDEKGTVYRVAGMAEDITRRKMVEEDLREQTRTIETVNRVGQTLAAELDMHKVVQAVTDAATELSGARFGSFFYNVLDQSGGWYMLYTLSGVPREAFMHFPMPRATDLFGPTFRGEGTIRIDDVKKDPRYGKWSPYYGMPEGHLPVTSYLAVPVISRSGEVIGGLFFGHPEAGVFTEREQRTVEGLASQAAVSVDNARLFDAAQKARAQSEIAERRSSFLAAASELLASSLEYETTLASVARLMVPHLADWCAVDILDEDRTIKRLAVAHQDESKVELARELEQRYPQQMSDHEGLAKVIRTGQSEIYEEIPDSMLLMGARDAEHLRILRELGLKSAMVVPLLVHERVLGAITFVYSESNRRYEQADLAFAEDLARRAAMGVENSRLYREAQVASRMKDEFLALVSHELRTPLTAVLGWGRMLHAGELDEETSKRAREIIMRNAETQRQLIEDLLDVSRIITGKLRLDVRALELAPVIKAAVDAVRPAAEAKGIKLHMVLDSGSGHIAGDADRLQQVVWNLLANAIKFTPKDGHVEVRLERINSHIELSVSDTGHGISQEFLPYVFDRFRQADPSMTRVYGGLGLGLAIVRHLVELHGGTVEVFSEGEGRGAKFTVQLPLMVFRNSDGNSGDLKRVHPKAGGVIPFTGEKNLDGLNILVVDDEQDTRDLLVAILEQCGAKVIALPSALEALAQIARLKPDVLVSDIGMPDLDGYEFIARVRSMENQNGKQIPAVALTAYARTEDRIRALNAGFQIHVPKPVEPTELTTVVATLAGRTGRA